jgi:hypothetical protein
MLARKNYSFVDTANTGGRRGRVATKERFKSGAIRSLAFASDSIRAVANRRDLQ